MKRTLSLLSNLLMSSTLFWGVPLAHAELVGGQEIVREPAEAASYCHMKFPPMSEQSLGWQEPAFEQGAENSIDFYGPCDHNPLGTEEARAQRQVQIRDEYGDIG